MKFPVYSSFLFSIFFMTDIVSESSYRTRDDGWDRRGRYSDDYDRDDRYDRQREQERTQKEHEERRKKYRSFSELTSIFDSIARKVSTDNLNNIFKVFQNTFGDDATYQVIDSLSQQNARHSLLEDFFDEDDGFQLISLKLDDNFYARLLSVLSLSKGMSQNTVQDFSLVIEQKLSGRWDDIKALKDRIMEQKMGYISKEKISPLVKIINQVAKNRHVSSKFVFNFFGRLQETFDEALAYQLIKTLSDGNIGNQLMREYFSDGKPSNKTDVVISAQFYATLVDELYQDEDIEPADVDIFVQISKDILKREWSEVESLQEEVTSQSEDAWGGADNTAQIKTDELDKILRQRNVSTDKIKAQFVVDFITTYAGMQASTTVVSVFGNIDTVADTRLDRFKKSLKMVKSTYIKKISNKRYARNISDADFAKNLTALIDSVQKTVMQVDGPRYTPWLFQMYLAKIQNQNLKMQIQNGLRVDVKKFFTDIAQLQTSGKPVQMNSDIVYLLCIQLIATLEQEISNGDSITKVQDFIKNARELLTVTLPSKLTNTPIVSSILQTILQTIPAQVQKPDSNILFGVGLFNMIKTFGLNNDMNQILVQRIQPTLSQMGISNQIVAQYKAQVTQHLQQLTVITTVNNSEQKLDVFSKSQQSAAVQQGKSQGILGKAMQVVDSASKTPIGKSFLSKIFG